MEYLPCFDNSCFGGLHLTAMTTKLDGFPGLRLFAGRWGFNRFAASRKLGGGKFCSNAILLARFTILQQAEVQFLVNNGMRG